MAKPVEAIRSQLAQQLVEVRRDALVFSVCTVLLTPFVLAVVLGLVLLAAANRGMANHSVHATVHATAEALLSLCFIVMAVIYFNRSVESLRRWGGLAVAFFVFLGLTVLLFGTSLPEQSPKPFWAIFGVGTLVMLGSLGFAYAPGDDTYMNAILHAGRYDPGMWDYEVRPWLYWGSSSRAERNAEVLMVATAIPVVSVVFGSWLEIFESAWLVRGLDEPELRLAAEILHGLAENEPEHVHRKLRLNARVTAALLKLELVKPHGPEFRLGRKAEKLVG